MGSDAYLGVAASLAHELADTAVWSGARCSWTGALPGDETRALGGRRIEAALGADLYGGTSGVALFLAEAAARLDDARLRATALGAIAHALDHAGRIAPALGDGLHAGRVGIAYAAARVARATGSEATREGARALLRAWRRGPHGSGGADVFEGSAGAVAGLVALTELVDEPWLLDMAAERGAVVVSTAHRTAAGWSWPDAVDPANHDLCGYLHGAAGIGHALAELYGATGDDRFAEGAAQAHRYERSWFERRSGAWPDLRGIARSAGSDAPAPAATSWCQGAPGIALARLRLERVLGPCDADAALSVTRGLAHDLAARVPDDFSLCHGAAGVADVLLYAAAHGRPEQHGPAADIGALGIERHHATGAGFPSGLPRGRTPSLFLGSAGIGLFYLRLADRSVATPLLVHPLDSPEQPSIESASDHEAR